MTSHGPPPPRRLDVCRLLAYSGPGMSSKREANDMASDPTTEHMRHLPRARDDHRTFAGIYRMPRAATATSGSTTEICDDAVFCVTCGGHHRPSAAHSDPHAVHARTYRIEQATATPSPSGRSTAQPCAKGIRRRQHERRERAHHGDTRTGGRLRNAPTAPARRAATIIVGAMPGAAGERRRQAARACRPGMSVGSGARQYADQSRHFVVCETCQTGDEILDNAPLSLKGDDE